MKELEEKKSKEALLLEQKHTICGDIRMKEMNKKAALIWKLEKDEEGGGLTGPSLL